MVIREGRSSQNVDLTGRPLDTRRLLDHSRYRYLQFGQKLLFWVYSWVRVTSSPIPPPPPHGKVPGRIITKYSYGSPTSLGVYRLWGLMYSWRFERWLFVGADCRTLETSAIHQTSRAKNVLYQPVLIKPIFILLTNPEKTGFFFKKKIVFQSTSRVHKKSRNVATHTTIPKTEDFF